MGVPLNGWGDYWKETREDQESTNDMSLYNIWNNSRIHIGCVSWEIWFPWNTLSNLLIRMVGLNKIVHLIWANLLFNCQKEREERIKEFSHVYFKYQERIMNLNDIALHYKTLRAKKKIKQKNKQTNKKHTHTKKTTPEQSLFNVPIKFTRISHTFLCIWILWDKEATVLKTVKRYTSLQKEWFAFVSALKSILLIGWKPQLKLMPYTLCQREGKANLYYIMWYIRKTEWTLAI